MLEFRNPYVFSGASTSVDFSVVGEWVQSSIDLG